VKYWLAVYVLLLLFANSVAAQDFPPLRSITYRVTGSALSIDYEHGDAIAPYVTTAKLLYQGFNAQNQTIGSPDQIDADASSSGSHLLFTLPIAKLAGAAEVVFAAQLGTAPHVSQTISTRVPLNVAHLLKLETDKVAELETRVRNLAKEADGLRALVDGPTCSVAPSVKFERVVASFPDHVVLYFTTPTAGRIRVHVPRGDGVVPFESDSLGTEHYVTVDKLKPDTSYSAEAWALTATKAEKPATRITKANHDSKMQFTTEPAAEAPTFNTASAKSEANDIVVTYDLDQEAAVEATLEQELRDSNGNTVYRTAGATTKKIVRDRFDRVTTSESPAIVQTIRFGSLTPDAVYRVTVRAANRYNQTREKKIGNIRAGNPLPTLDFGSTVDISITPLGYLLTWTATVDPDAEPAVLGPLDQPNAGLKISFPSHPEASAVTVPAGRDMNRKFTAMLDTKSLNEVLERAAVLKETPLLTVYMKKEKATVSRSMRVRFETPSKQQVQALGLSDPAKDVLKTKLDELVTKRKINIDWKKLASEGFKVLVDVIL
jgi:hypothetical protein